MVRRSSQGPVQERERALRVSGLQARAEGGLPPEKEIDVFKNLVLRNGGDDGMYDHPRMRDSLMHALWAEEAGDVSARRPVFVYLNGQPWGIYNLRERIDSHYVAANDRSGEADLIRDVRDVLQGDIDHSHPVHQGSCEYTA